MLIILQHNIKILSLMFLNSFFKHYYARYIACVLFLCVLLISNTSCQNHNFICNPDPYTSSVDEVNERIELSENISSKWFSFDSIISNTKWKYSDDIDWRLSQIQIPETELTTMPTSVLVKLCLDYPFFLDYTAADDYSDGISRLMSTFNGFKELIKRKDALKELTSQINAISVSEIVENAKNVHNDTSPKDNILYVNYVELLLSQIVSSQKDVNTILNLDVEQTSQRLLQEKSKYPDIYGPYSIEASKLCEESITTAKRNGVSIASSGNTISTESISTITLTTTFGRTVIGLVGLPELSASEKSSSDSYYRRTYPSATLLASSTSSYNCHSYAWNMSERGVTCWINGSNISQPNLDGTVSANNDNISQYWFDGLYSMTIDRYAQKIYYYRGDHSAIQSSVSGKYESKWGKGPLMRHSPTNCPSIYYSKYRSYFKKANPIIVCTAGVREIYVNETCTYSADGLPTGLDTSYRWEVVDNKNGDDVVGIYDTIQNESECSADVTFTRRGIYYINLYRTHANRGEILCSLDVYVVPPKNN